MSSRIGWHELFITQCYLFALRSTCSRLRVGSVIVRNNRVISGGYNGSVSGDTHCIDEGCHMVSGHCARSVHSEMNALLQCSKYGTETDGAVIYITHFPCLSCTKAIIQAGIQEVYYAEDYRNDSYAEEILAKSGITVTKIDKPEHVNQMQTR